LSIDGISPDLSETGRSGWLTLDRHRARVMAEAGEGLSVPRLLSAIQRHADHLR
jgi:hypothetical protein